MLLRNDPRPESPTPPPTWMGVVTGLALLGAMVALMFHDYRMADVGIILCNVLFLLLAFRRMSPRETRRFWLVAFVLLNAVLLLGSQQDRRVIVLVDMGGLILFALALVATRIWPDKIWLRRDGPRSRG
jgi:hypothetical protein